MTDISAGIQANVALTRQAIALETVKKSAEAERAIANVLDEAVGSVPSSSVRGSNLDILA